MYRAKAFLREQHQHMLVTQLQRLEDRKREIAREREQRARERREKGEPSVSGCVYAWVGDGVGFWASTGRTYCNTNLLLVSRYQPIT